jgi:hypothetical protein
MTHFDGVSLSVPSTWAELYFDVQDPDGARLREIVAGDPRLQAAGFRAFLEQERARLHTLSIYGVGVLIVDCREGSAGPSGARPWPVESETARRLVDLFRGRAGQTPAPDCAAGENKGPRLLALPQASPPPGNGPPRPLDQEPLEHALPDRSEHGLLPGDHSGEVEDVDLSEFGLGVAKPDLGPETMTFGKLTPKASSEHDILLEDLSLPPNPVTGSSSVIIGVSTSGKKLPDCDIRLALDTFRGASDSEASEPSPKDSESVGPATAPPFEATVPPNGLPSLADSAPARIGDYQIVRQIGQGGMGVVYLGKHIHLDRFVAIKVLPAVLFNEPKAVDRLVREARIGARLRHSSICQILDARQEGGEFYFVMEYVAGESLQQVLRREGPLPISKACDLALQLFDALKYLARRGIVHRDIKPSNLMVSPEGRLKLLDLGLAKVTGALQGMPDVTRTGDVMGTPAYMAPEQISDAKNVSVTADLYAAGTTFFEMLTGERPFSGPF